MHKESRMSPLKAVLTVKIIFTAFFWSLPLLLAPRHATGLLGIPLSQPVLFLRLLGAAFLALLAGYVLGLLDLHHGREARNTVWVGIISNGSAFLILVVSRAEWGGWGPRASVFMWGSAVVTLLITLGLIVFGVVYKRATRR